MADRQDLYLRSHTVPLKPQKEYQNNRRAKMPEDALIFRCATTTDEKKDLLFGAFICAQLEHGYFVAREIGLFFRDGHPDETRVLDRFARTSTYELVSENQFRRNVFLKYLKADALVVAYDAPEQVSRFAIKANKSKKRPRAFSFYFRMFWDKKTGKIRPSGYEPGLSIQSLDASKALYGLIKYKFHEEDAERQEKEQQSSNVHILDLKTLITVLTGASSTFHSACEIFGVPVSKARKSYARVTKAAIERLLRDVTAELDLLNRLKEEFDRHVA